MRILIAIIIAILTALLGVGHPVEEVSVAPMEPVVKAETAVVEESGDLVEPAPETDPPFLDALYSTATKENKSVHYAVTGWRKIDGEQRFLMPGDEDYSVDLDGKLKNYHLSHEIAFWMFCLGVKMLRNQAPVFSE